MINRKFIREGLSKFDLLLLHASKDVMDNFRESTNDTDKKVQISTLIYALDFESLSWILIKIGLIESNLCENLYINHIASMYHEEVNDIESNPAVEGVILTARFTLQYLNATSTHEKIKLRSKTISDRHTFGCIHRVNPDEKYIVPNCIHATWYCLGMASYQNALLPSTSNITLAILEVYEYKKAKSIISKMQKSCRDCFRRVLNDTRSNKA